jgi:hypothetical protein
MVLMLLTTGYKKHLNILWCIFISMGWSNGFRKRGYAGAPDVRADRIQ